MNLPAARVRPTASGARREPDLLGLLVLQPVA